VLGRVSDRGDAARGEHHERLRELSRCARLGETSQIATHERCQIRVDRRRRGPLVLAELGRDLVGSDDVRRRKSLPKVLDDMTLVGRVPKREEEAHRDRLGVELRHRLEVELLEDAVWPDALADGVAALEWNERLGVSGAEAVEVRPRLAPEVKYVLEAGRADEGRPRAFPLEQRVRGHGRPMGEPLDALGAHGPRRLDDGVRLPRRRRNLGRPYLPLGEKNGVGEGSAYVDAEHRHG
jgi:hypothetical protein